MPDTLRISPPSVTRFYDTDTALNFDKNERVFRDKLHSRRRASGDGSLYASPSLPLF